MGAWLAWRVPQERVSVYVAAVTVAAALLTVVCALLDGRWPTALGLLVNVLAADYMAWRRL